MPPRRSRGYGHLLVLEGPDDAGKTTLSKALATALRKRGHKVCLESFPGHRDHTLGSHIYRLHHNPSEFDVDLHSPLARQMLHVAAHIDSIVGYIKPKLSNGTTLILDRYWWSTYIYGYLSGIPRHSLRQLIALERSIWQPVAPTALFLITRLARNGDSDVEPSDELSSSYATFLESVGREFDVSHPIMTVQNDGSVSESIRRMLNFLESTTTGSLEP